MADSTRRPSFMGLDLGANGANGRRPSFMGIEALGLGDGKAVRRRPSAITRELGPTETLELHSGLVGLGISWDVDEKAVDVDLQAVVVSGSGSIIDAVYQNNVKAQQKCIAHTGGGAGDELGAAKNEFGHFETIWCRLQQMPEVVKLIIFVVAAHGGGHLHDVTNGTIHVMQEKIGEIGSFPMERSEHEVDVVATLTRSGSSRWSLYVVDEPAQGGRHFIDVLEPTIGDIVRKAIPKAPKPIKVAFSMQKNGVLDLPQSSSNQTVIAKVGWDVLGRGINLDISAVLFNSEGEPFGCASSDHPQSCGLEHSGDDDTGEGEVKDQQIKCNLGFVPKQVSQIFFCVHIRKTGVTFDKIRNAHCNVCDGSGSQLANFKLKEGGHTSALIMARLFREAEDERWGFQALGTFTRGYSWKESMNDMTAIFNKAPHKLQAHYEHLTRRDSSKEEVLQEVDGTGDGCNVCQAGCALQ